MSATGRGVSVMLVLFTHGGSSTRLGAGTGDTRTHGMPDRGINQELGREKGVCGDNIHYSTLKLDAFMVAQVGGGASLADELRDHQFNLGVKPDLSTEESQKLRNGPVNTVNGTAKLAHEEMVRVRMQCSVTKFSTLVAFLVVLATGANGIERET